MLMDENGVGIGSADAPFSVAHPKFGWSEQDPRIWTDACEAVLSALRQNHGKALAATRAIGLSGQMHGATLIGADGAVLRPSILWNDTRASVEAAQLDAGAGVRDISGNIVFPGFTAPKLLWVEKHEPGLFAKIVKVLLPKDYLRWWLTGDFVSDMSDSAGTSWLDVGNRRWSNQLLEAGHMRLDQMPALIEGSEISGELRPELAKSWGLAANVKIAGGGGDNAASACGVGCIGEGQGFVSLGTSGVLLAARAGFTPKPALGVHSFCHALPDTWYQMGVILAATDSLNWLSRIAGKSPADLAAALPPETGGPSLIRFCPYLSGERTPHNDSEVRGAFTGLDVAHDLGDLTRAVMEGVAFALRDSLEALETAGVNLPGVLVIGGGTGSAFWTDTLANVLGLPVHLPAAGEFGAALGAARLAGVGATGADAKSFMTPPAIARFVDPKPALKATFEDAYRHYCELYPILKGKTS